MTQHELHLHWSQIEGRAFDRSGKWKRFKRATLYGGRIEGGLTFTQTIKALPNMAISKLGGNGKGLRKMIRTAPVQVPLRGIGIAAGFAIPSVGDISQANKIVNEGSKVGIKVCVSLAEKAMDTAATLATSKLVSSATDQMLSSVNSTRFRDYFIPEANMGVGRKIKESIYSKTTVFGTLKEEQHKPSEALRRRIKYTIKAMAKENSFLVIDRNLVKLKDAKEKVDPAVKKLLEPAQTIKNNAYRDKKYNEAEDALRAVAETEYYIKKVSGVMTHVREQAMQVRHDLENLQHEVYNIKDQIFSTILAMYSINETPSK